LTLADLSNRDLVKGYWGIAESLGTIGFMTKTLAKVTLGLSSKEPFTTSMEHLKSWAHNTGSCNGYYGTAVPWELDGGHCHCDHSFFTHLISGWPALEQKSRKDSSGPSLDTSKEGWPSGYRPAKTQLLGLFSKPWVIPSMDSG
jgi:hypothetical protein